MRDPVAPYEGGARVRLPEQGLLTSRRLRGPAPTGWGVFRAEADEARWVRAADPWELPRDVRTLVLLGRDAHDRWWGCAPGRRPGYPVRVRLVQEAQELDQIHAWFDGDHHWQTAALSTDPRLRESLQAAVPPRDLPTGLRPGDCEAYRLAWSLGRSQDPQPRIQRALALAQARLEAWQPVPQGFRVTWTRLGERFVSILGPDLAVLDAGFCLAGTDRVHDLTSLASLVAERPLS